jgi:hypothetical protein
MTQYKFRFYGRSLLISLAIVGIIAGIANFTHFDGIWLLLAPGAFLAAIAFPEGINSSAGNAFLIVAGALDIALFALPIMWFFNRYRGGAKRRT